MRLETTIKAIKVVILSAKSSLTVQRYEVFLKVPNISGLFLLPDDFSCKVLLYFQFYLYLCNCIAVYAGRTACMAISINADHKKPLVKAAREFFMSKMNSKELATSVEGNVLIYRSSTGKVNVSVIFNNDNLWLSQKRMSELYAVDVSTINYHLKQLNDSNELHLSEAIRKIQIPSEKWDEQGVLLYNLDAIIAVGYRVNSYEATQFRIWAR